MELDITFDQDDSLEPSYMNKLQEREVLNGPALQKFRAFEEAQVTEIDLTEPEDEEMELPAWLMPKAMPVYDDIPGSPTPKDIPKKPDPTLGEQITEGATELWEKVSWPFKEPFQPEGPRTNPVARGVGLGIVDGAQGIVDIARDVTNVMGGDFQEDEWLKIPHIIEEGKGSPAESVARGIAQFMGVFGAVGGFAKGAKLSSQMLAGALADASFDPTEGNLGTLLRQLDVDNALTQFLDSQVGEEATAEERLTARAKQMLEGAGLSFAVPAIIAGLRAMKTDAGPIIKDWLQGSDPDMLPRVIEKVTGVDPRMGATTFHGSPHKFDQFDHAHMGSGEGGQAYGWGTYLAENPDVAKSYTPRDYDMEEEVLKLYNDAMDFQKGTDDPVKFDMYERALMHETPEEIASYAKETYDGDDLVRANQAIEEYRKLYEKSQFNFYEADLPDEAIDKMIDWDVKLYDQDQATKEALEQLYPGFIEQSDRYAKIEAQLAKLDSKTDKTKVDELMKELIHIKRDLKVNPDDTGGAFYRGLEVRHGSDQKASEFLHKQGIPGVKFLDQNSRAVGEGSRNFVIFKEDTATLTKRNEQAIKGTAAATATATGVAQAQDKQVRNVRNNNPGNIKDFGDKWDGMTGTDAGGDVAEGSFVVFDTPEHGVRALTKDITNKRKRGLNTIAKILEVYAPEGKENNLKAYISDVSNDVGIRPNTVLKDANMFKLIKAITKHEGGKASLEHFTDSILAKGMDMAYPKRYNKHVKQLLNEDK